MAANPPSNLILNLILILTWNLILNLIMNLILNLVLVLILMAGLSHHTLGRRFHSWTHRKNEAAFIGGI